MKLYISGPMTGYPDLNRPKFEAMFKRLRDMGHEPVTPFDLNRDTADYRTALANDLDYICSEAEGVVMLCGFQSSPGAHAENATGAGHQDTDLVGAERRYNRAGRQYWREPLRGSDE